MLEKKFQFKPFFANAMPILKKEEDIHKTKKCLRPFLREAETKLGPMAPVLVHQALFLDDKPKTARC
jgi:hypothetical protein